MFERIYIGKTIERYLGNIPVRATLVFPPFYKVTEEDRARIEELKAREKGVKYFRVDRELRKAIDDFCGK